MSKDLLVLADEYAAATATFARALALKDGADSMSPIARDAGDKRAALAEALAALDTAQPEPVNAMLVGAVEEFLADYRSDDGMNSMKHYARKFDAALAAAKQAQPERVELKVVVHSYPESNGKRNWTAMIKRVKPFDGLVGSCGGITVARGECWNRVAYEAERTRVLLGERTNEPDILGYVNDVATPEEWTGNDPEAAHAIKQGGHHD